MIEIVTQAVVILLKVIGGLGVFMLGMKFLSEGIQTVAGPSLRRLISRITDNRFLATGTGTLFTLLVQSSSIATVVMVGLVNAGLMQLHQAVGFIMGANIGTTITGWILMFKVGEFGLPVLGSAALVYVFAKRDRIRFIAMAVMGLGMVFFGLQLMKDGVAPLKQMEGINAMLATLNADSYFGILFCVMLGCLLTFLVQSSSAALAILVAVASEGLISFPAAAAFILGENIGTTITVVIASIGATTNAKRAALAHVLFNVIGVTWVVISFPIAVRLVAWGVQSVYGVDPMTMNFDAFADKTEYAKLITGGIASMHTSFNLCNTALFLAFVPQFARLLMWLIPDTATTEVPHLKYLTAGSVESPAIGIEQSRREMIVMAERTVKLMARVHSACYDDQLTPENVAQINADEQTMDNIEQEIVAFLTRTLQSTVSAEVVAEGQAQLRLAHELESIGDHLANIAKDFERLQRQDMSLSSEQQRELRDLHAQIFAYLEQLVIGYSNNSLPAAGEAKDTSRRIVDSIKELRAKQMQRVVDTNLNPALTLAYTGTLTHYRRIRGHILNALQAVANA
jgi:phosphate:Na+ symporter